MPESSRSAANLGDVQRVDLAHSLLGQSVANLHPNRKPQRVFLIAHVTTLDSGSCVYSSTRSTPVLQAA